jgi:hypothetical protein
VRAAPAHQAAQFGAIGAQRVGRAPGSVAQEERQRLCIVGGAERVGRRVRLGEAAGAREPRVVSRAVSGQPRVRRDSSLASAAVGTVASLAKAAVDRMRRRCVCSSRARTVSGRGARSAVTVRRRPRSQYSTAPSCASSSLSTVGCAALASASEP